MSDESVNDHLPLETGLQSNEEPHVDGQRLERGSVQTASSSRDSARYTSSLTATNYTSSTTPATSINLNLSCDVSSSDGPTQGAKGFESPDTTIIELISTSATAPAFPESFGLTISQKGLWIAAYTSTALYIIRSENLPGVGGRFFKVRRKPLAMAISDDPQSLAILSNSHNVDVYSNGDGEGHSGTWSNLKQRSIIFGHEISTIALSPDANILAAGYRGGVEIVSVAQGASENSRRQISCEPMVEIAFSDDGRSLLATWTLKKTRPSTVISVGSGLDGPITDDGIMDPIPPDQAWISQLVFPERASHARQAAMMPDNMTGQVNELFAFNAEDDSWGIYDLTVKRFSEKKVDVLDLMPSTRKMNYETSLPAVASDYSQVALAAKHTSRSDVLIYQIPFSWRVDSPVSATPHSNEPEALQPAHVVSLLMEEGAAPESITTLRWLGRNKSSSEPKRLLALATSVAQPVDEEIGTMAPAACGRIVVIDFTPRSRPTSSPRKVTINFDQLPEEVLGDEHMDFDREVSLLRSRTQVIRRRSSNNSNDPRRVARSSTSLGVHGRTNGLLSPSDISEASLTRRHSLSSITSDETDQSFGALVLDEPYSQTQPRSQFSLQRAATISAQSGANRRHLLALPNRPLDYRRADGLRWIPHESDADNWVPPPPPYSREVDPTVSQTLIQPLPTPPAEEPSTPPLAMSTRVTPTRTPIPRRPVGAPPVVIPSVAAQPIPEQAISRPSTTSSIASGMQMPPRVQTSSSLQPQPRGPSMTGNAIPSPLQTPTSLSGRPPLQHRSSSSLQMRANMAPPSPLGNSSGIPTPPLQMRSNILTPPALQMRSSIPNPPALQSRSSIPTPSPLQARASMPLSLQIGIPSLNRNSTMPAGFPLQPVDRTSTGSMLDQGQGSRRVTSIDLARPLPPLPNESRRPKDRLRKLVLNQGTVNDGRRAPAPSGPNTDSRQKKRGTKCVVM